MTHEPPFAVENWKHWQPGLRRVPFGWLSTQRKLQSLSRASRSDHHVFIPSHDFMMGPRQWDGGGGIFGCGGDLGGAKLVDRDAELIRRVFTLQVLDRPQTTRNEHAVHDRIHGRSNSI